MTDATPETRALHCLDADGGMPSSRDVQATLTDFYELTMLYGFWKAERHNVHAVYDVSFRKCPFDGEFAVLAGVDELIRFINSMRFTDEQIRYIRSVLHVEDDAFFEYLKTITGAALQIYAVKEGTLVFPNVPVVRVEGPLGVCQIIETTLLNLLNFPTLVATNAARHRLAAGWDKKLFEFGARRAQGPNGAITASRYCYLGTFDATSNVMAGHLFGIELCGTHAHAYVMAFSGLNDLVSQDFHATINGKKIHWTDFVPRVKSWQQKLCKRFPHLFKEEGCREGELAAFIAYAQAFPNRFLALVDTFDTLTSGIPNFLSVALTLAEGTIPPVGIRLDSGDLAYLSNKARSIFLLVADAFNQPLIKKLIIVASNNVNEDVLKSLTEQNHAIDCFGIGTNLVTCQAQPALGMIYKLAEVGDRPCMKLSQDVVKASLPGRKDLYRLYTKNGEPCVDLLQGAHEPAPETGTAAFCRHLFNSTQRCYVVPEKVECLLCLMWDRGKRTFCESLQASRERCFSQLHLFRKDILRPINPAPYKVSASSKFYDFFHQMWQDTVPVSDGQLSRPVAQDEDSHCKSEVEIHYVNLLSEKISKPYSRRLFSCKTLC